MAQIIVSLANDGEFDRQEIEADSVHVGTDGNLELHDKEDCKVAEFALWAWYAKKEHVQQRHR